MIERQTRVLDSGGRVEQVTMGWDEESHRTVFQRSKEGSADYRYFPEPDLPPVETGPEALAAIRARLPELPEPRRDRFVRELGVRIEDAALLADDRATGDYFEAAVAAGGLSAQTVANWITGELFRLLRDSGTEIGATRVSPRALAELLTLLDKGAINATVAKEVLGEMFATGQSAEQIVAQKGLTQISDEDALVSVVRQVLDTNPGPVQQFLEGKETVLAFLIGQIMRATRGQANAQVARNLLQQELARRK